MTATTTTVLRCDGVNCREQIVARPRETDYELRRRDARAGVAIQHPPPRSPARLLPVACVMWAPETQPRDTPASRCRRACCWTPYQCATNHHCECHEEKDE